MIGRKFKARDTCRSLLESAIMFVLLMTFSGCSNDAPVADPSTNSVTLSNEASGASAPAAQLPQNAKDSVDSSTVEPARKIDFKPLALNGLGGTSTDATSADSKPDPEKEIRTIISKLQPLQVLLGQWRGTTRREYENFKAVDNHEWVWDLRTRPNQPALIIQSDKSPYISTGRVTWDTSQNKFVLTTTDPAGVTRDFTGDFTEPVHEIVGSDDKLHKVFRLEFNQAEDSESGELWQLAFTQQENNRYLLEVAKRRGKASFARFDTVSTQREGTSFAVSDSGYAEKTCIISEGLGTMEVTYKGRSYWVCCTGCKAAFEEDPETWIARAAKKDVPKSN